MKRSLILLILLLSVSCESAFSESHNQSIEVNTQNGVPVTDDEEPEEFPSSDEGSSSANRGPIGEEDKQETVVVYETSHPTH